MNYSKCPKCKKDPILFEDKIMGVWYHIIHTNKICKNCSQPLKVNQDAVLIFIILHITGFLSIGLLAIILISLKDLFHMLFQNTAWTEAVAVILAIFWIFCSAMLGLIVPSIFDRLYGKSIYKFRKS